MSNNPFLVSPARTRREAQALMEADPLWDDQASGVGGDVAVVGPATPELVGPVDTENLEDWPTTVLNDVPDLCVMGLHGGAGASTLLQLLSPADEGAGAGPTPTVGEAGREWPVANAWLTPAPMVRVVAVARTHHHGLDRADRLARLWAAGRLPGAELVGLVLVDDGPRLTKAQAQAVRRLARMTPRGWHLPWAERWRWESPSPSTCGLRVRRIAASILAAAAGDTKGTNR
ncbi:DUF6668 family protein [Isoptericola sp. NPDC056134]|uniref:DUF6668 family protein n=1 Tax=Isoptericola sp. NPDC056134 TaxID=3345723 RepID=UPI0035ED7480